MKQSNRFFFSFIEISSSSFQQHVDFEYFKVFSFFFISISSSIFKNRITSYIYNPIKTNKQTNKQHTIHSFKYIWWITWWSNHFEFFSSQILDSWYVVLFDFYFILFSVSTLFTVHGSIVVIVRDQIDCHVDIYCEWMKNNDWKFFFLYVCLKILWIIVMVSFLFLLFSRLYIYRIELVFSFFFLIEYNEHWNGIIESTMKINENKEKWNEIYMEHAISFLTFNQISIGSNEKKIGWFCFLLFLILNFGFNIVNLMLLNATWCWWWLSRIDQKIDVTSKKKSVDEFVFLCFHYFA